jgi:hypothetical protein
LVKEAITTEYQGAAAFVDGHTLWLSSSLGGGGAGVVPAAYMDWLRRAARCFNPGAPVGDAPDGPVGMSLVWPTKEEADRYLDDCPGLWVTPGVVASLVAAGSLVRGAQHIAAQLPPHAKVAVLYRQEQLASGPQTRLAYALVGSANASPVRPA